MKTREFVVSGRVQGVSFRYHTLRAAVDIGVRGYVRNLPDGRVQVVAQGDDAQLAAMREYVHRGSPWARVDTVAETALSGVEEYADFRIVA